MAKSGNSLSKTAVWILMGLLILGLGGFGIDGVLNSQVTRVASVGDKTVEVDSYYRALRNAIQQETQNRGEVVTMEQARALGIDQAVLSQLVTQSALDHEASELGISIGDENLRDQIVAIRAFQGVDGQFDRESYQFALENSGLTEVQFQEQLRSESARTILQGALLSGIVMPDTYAQTLVDYVGETRNFTWARLDQDDLPPDLPEADEATLKAYYQENIDDFGLPETKRISFAVLRPEQVLPTIDVDEAALRQAYDDRIEQFRQPERRLVERLVYLDDAAAEAAAAQLEVDGNTFEALVEARGLALEDVDMGDVGRLELGSAGEGVFAAEVGDIVGPLPSDLGPALFRINGVLPAQNTTFEEAEPRLRVELARDQAERLIATQAEDFEDILAGGATLEELTEETDMELGQIDWFSDIGDGIAAYIEFRRAAARVQSGDFPSILPLADGGIFALRLDEVLPPRPAPYETVVDGVTANWEADRAEEVLMETAKTLVPKLTAGTDFAGIELDSLVEEDLNRTGFVNGTPPDFTGTIFEMEIGEVRTIESFGTVIIARLDAINPTSENADARDLQVRLETEMNQALARNLFTIFAQDTLLRAGQEIDVQALEAVHQNIP